MLSFLNVTPGLGKGETEPNLNQTLLDYYRLPADSLPSSNTANTGVSGEIGFFQLGPGNICYGQCNTGVANDLKGSGAYDSLKHVSFDGQTVQLPFAFT